MSKSSPPKEESSRSVDVDEIMREIRATVDEKRRSGDYREVLAQLNQPVAVATPTPVGEEQPSGIALQRLSDKWTLPKSHRAGVIGGTAGWLLRKLFGAVQVFFGQIIATQEQNNQQLANAIARLTVELQQTTQEVGRLMAELQQTTQEVGRLKDAHSQNIQALMGMQQDVSRIFRDTLLKQIESHRKTLDTYDQIVAQHNAYENLEVRTQELINQLGSNAQSVDRLTSFQEEIQARLDQLDGQQVDNRRLLLRAVKQQTETDK